MSFSATVTDYYEGTVENDGFWPALDLKVLMQSYRIDTRLPETTIRDIVVSAMLVVNDELSAWKAEQQAVCPDEEPVEILAAVKPDKEIDGKHLYTRLYISAVSNRAKGDYLKEFPDYSTTGANGQRGKGEDRVAEKQEHAGHYHAASLKAIRRIKGRSRTRVALIKGNLQEPFPGQFC